jgi:hypothetical protein
VKNNVKKIIIGIIIILIIAAVCFFTVTRLQQSNRQRVIDAVQSGVDNLAELERQQRAINRGFDRTIAEQRRILAARQGIIDRRNDTIKQRESELKTTNGLIERLSNLGGSEEESLGRLGQIHRELEKRNNEAGKKDIILEKSDFD